MSSVVFVRLQQFCDQSCPAGLVAFPTEIFYSLAADATGRSGGTVDIRCDGGVLLLFNSDEQVLRLIETVWDSLKETAEAAALTAPEPPGPLS